MREEFTGLAAPLTRDSTLLADFGGMSFDHDALDRLTDARQQQAGVS